MSSRSAPGAWIVARFRPITEFVVDNADCLDWDAFTRALAAHVRHRNGPDRGRRIADRERKCQRRRGWRAPS